MKKSVKSVASLTLICLVTAVLLSVVNHFTAPIITKAEEAAANEALLVVMPDGEGFEKVDLSSYELPATVKEAYKEKNGGVVVKTETSGYSSGLVIMCGVNPDGTVSGAVCLSSSETLGYEKTYGDNFKDLDMSAVDAVDTISGATRTTAAYKNAIKDAINTLLILAGGEVDLRTDEEKLQDALREVLPAGDSFTKDFVCEILDGVDAVYSAANGEGYVFAAGELYIAVDKNGNIVSEADEATRAIVLAAYNAHTSSSSTAIDLSAVEGISQRIKEASLTASGNYIIVAEGAGYGINGRYHASGEYILVKAAVSADGNIISCVTVYENESDGIGSVCGEPSYYEQYNGKNESDYTSVDIISGATVTSHGYQKALARIFETINILKGAE